MYQLATLKGKWKSINRNILYVPFWYNSTGMPDTKTQFVGWDCICFCYLAAIRIINRLLNIEISSLIGHQGCSLYTVKLYYLHTLSHPLLLGWRWKCRQDRPDTLWHRNLAGSDPAGMIRRSPTHSESDYQVYTALQTHASHYITRKESHQININWWLFVSYISLS